MMSETNGSLPPKQVSQLIIAIDGPSAAGKSTVSQKLAKRLGLTFLNTGAMYRAIAHKAARLGLDFTDDGALTRLAKDSQIELTGDPDHVRIIIDGEDVTEAIRTPVVSQLSSVISTLAGVRRAMVAAQRRMCSQGGVVLEGRDTGTHVFPEADVKIFLGANPEVRARRRWEEERNAGRQLEFEKLAQEIVERDLRDQTRTDSPLRPAKDAIIIDSSHLSADQVVEQILEFVRNKWPPNQLAPD